MKIKFTPHSFFLPLILVFAITGLKAQYEVQSIYLQNPDTIIPHLLRSADFWKTSADWEDGGFYMEVNQDGTPELTTRKSFVQCSRHTYGFTRAFMVSGDETYLDYAEHAIQFVYDHGWDTLHGGWFFSSDKAGIPSPPYGNAWNPNNNKWSFQQHYDVLGIGAIAEATRSPLHLQWFDRATLFNDSLLWDSRPGFEGFYDTADLDWQNPGGKGFTPTVDAATTWVLARALLTGAPEDKARLLAVSDNITEYLYESMFSPQVNFGFAERYNSNWVLNTNNKNGSTGHVIKTAWCLARAYMLEPTYAYREAAQDMIDEIMFNGGYDYNNGGLFANYNWSTGVIQQNKNHWMLEQGVTSGLMNYYLAEDSLDRDLNLGMADGCLDFYMEHFIDEEFGECYTATDAAGVVTNADKSDPFKGGYHNIELAYLTYLYGKLFLHEEPVSLYYRFGESTQPRQFKMTPLAIIDDQLFISSITLDGVPYTDFDSEGRLLNLPAGTGGIFKITYNLDGEFVATRSRENISPARVYPNPAAQFFLVENIPGPARVSLIKLDGQVVKTFDGVTAGQLLAIEDLPKGMYVVFIEADGQMQRQKLVKL